MFPGGGGGGGACVDLCCSCACVAQKKIQGRGKCPLCPNETLL